MSEEPPFCTAPKVPLRLHSLPAVDRLGCTQGFVFAQSPRVHQHFWCLLIDVSQSGLVGKGCFSLLTLVQALSAPRPPTQILRAVRRSTLHTVLGSGSILPSGLNSSSYIAHTAIVGQTINILRIHLPSDRGHWWKPHDLQGPRSPASRRSALPACLGEADQGR